ncbi:hypothetical protein EYZ11_002465 [Aspergillus tanneri]|uniref:Mediator of RNA polymerase II transcription subunit 12 n=1 Tax=Aspergillus tanneri TaxID=1220188 RepID=A0A4S3JQN4_9EURO|nr:hypothetical protein EYZ11_002465 [Aspergillus tanneri]
MRALNSGSGRVDASQVLGPSDPQLEKLPVPVSQSQPRQPAVIDLTTSSGEARDREHPAKRLRLDLPASSSAGDGSPASGSGGEPRSTPGASSSKPPFLGWRGRPLWSFQALVSEAPAPTETKEDDGTDVAQGGKTSPPPLPTLPWKYGPPQLLGRKAAKSRDSSPSKAVQTTPYRIEVPSVAPIIKGDSEYLMVFDIGAHASNQIAEVADFSPWSGNHPEDVLNEQTAKQGHYDRTQVSQNESNTARPSVYAQLKHRSGLQLLSSVFSAALEKRQNHTLVTAPSTFKPPPRVTLTDNKREAWLRDLANPGKALLDQCLSKWIPVSRAVWLAKCVGANEIRAFKRKGTSGAIAVGLEAKWVRDWTSTVQQFLEGVISICGSSEWKLKMTYAVSLTARLFFERLLDHDQYLGWFLSSLEASSTKTVPVWLLMLGIYWDNIMCYRKRGRRLAEALLEKLCHINNPEQVAPFRPLVDRLSLYIRRLVLEHTSSVILPRSWDKYKDLISSCLNMKDNVHRAIFQNLVERNLRVQTPKGHKEAVHRSPQQRAIHLFDSIRSANDISSASCECLKTIEDKTVLVYKLLEWTATPCRYGICRVYTGVRLLRKWKMSGIDIDSYILAFLAGVRATTPLKMDNIYHIISELVRSQTFSVGRYLQWLMARGVTSDVHPDTHEVIPDDLYLLKQLPTTRLPEHLRNLRNTLLHRAGISVADEETTIMELKASVAQRLPNIFGAELTDMIMDRTQRQDLTWAVKSEIGQWIRRGVAAHSRDPPSVRDILESFGDLSILADVLKQATNCEDNVVLASVADTVNYHFDSFCVIGATTDLFRGLVDSYSRIKRLGMPSLDLVFSLIELGLRLPDELNTVALLRQDLSRIDSKSALAAPSPLSDIIPLSFSEVDRSYQEKLDQILSSGNGIDEPTMDTFFNSLTKALADTKDEDKLSANETFRWICGLFKSSPPGIMTRILPPLIGVGCVTIHAFLLLVKRLLQSERVASVAPKLGDLRMDLLELLIPPEPERGRYFDLVTYRFYLVQQEFRVKHPQETLDIIQDAVVLIDARHEETGFDSKRTNLARRAIGLLHIMLTQDPQMVAQHCLEKFTGQQATTTILQKAIGMLLESDARSGPQCISEAERVIHMTDDFSLPFCQLKLQMLFNAESGEDVKDGIVDVMFNAAVNESRSKGTNWAGLVDLMSQDAIRQIRERAEKEFLSIPLFEESPDNDVLGAGTGSLETAKLYLAIIEKLAYSIPEAGVPSIAPILVDKMDVLLHKLVTVQTNFNSVATNSGGPPADNLAQFRLDFERALAFWFSALLKMVVMHRAAFNASSPAPRHNGIQEQSRLLVSIFSISLARLPDNVLRLFPVADYFPRRVPSEGYQPCPGILLQTHALDVAASLIDIFSDESRHQCARFLKERCPPFTQHQNDPRFLYLLGPTTDLPAPNTAQPVSLPSPAAGGSTPAPTPSGSLPGGPAAQQPVVPAPTGVANGPSEGVNCVASQLRLQFRGRVMGPYPVRPWELLEDAAPIVGINDTAVNLKYFDARRVRA